eukprot:Gb_33234 [translate_table: standard]
MESVGKLPSFNTVGHPPLRSVPSFSPHISSLPCQYFSSGFTKTMMPLEATYCSILAVSSSVSTVKSSFATEEESKACRKFPHGGTANSVCSRFLTVFKGSLPLRLYSTSPLKSRGTVAVKAQNEDSTSESDSAEGAMQATVEQSKKVLAMQTALLQKIAGRRKLVSSIKDNFGSLANNGKAFDENDNSEKDQKSDNIEEEAMEQNGDPNFAEIPSESAASANFFSKDQASLESVPDTRTSDALEFSRQSSASLRSSPSTTPLPTPVVLAPELKNEDVQVSEKEPEAKSEEDVKDDEASGMAEAKPPPLAGPNVMNIIVVAAECAPWSKTGGLGDVVGALPKALARRGHRVMVVVPRYSNYREGCEIGIRKKYKIDGQDMEVSYFHEYIEGVDFVFISSPIFHGFANNIYGGNRPDILKRMVLFCKAAVEVPWYAPCGGACYGDGNLVFIANDWHTALLPVYLKAYYRDHGLMKFTRSVLVIHNMAHQGRGPMADYKLLGLPDHYMDHFDLYDYIGGQHMNIFMAGLKTAHRIVAVSHGYARECHTSEGGWGLHNIIQENSWKLRGIVNGIDDIEWNPELDAHLKTDGYVNYSIETLETSKPACKAALQKELGLPVRSDVPLIGFIGRLDHQKGVDIIAESMSWIVQQDLQLVILGTGRDDLESMVRSFEQQYRDKVRARVGFSVRTAHCITAGSDILLMPSRFEPCGLNQLYAMRYGTVPVVHAVGGLRDTVKPFDPFAETGLGWTFERAEASCLIHALSNAIWTYRDFKKSWLGIQKRGMSQDLSWDNAAQQYEEVILAAKYQW